MLFLKKITQNTYLKNIFSVGSGNIAAQAITLALSPIITRLYSPEDMGILSLFLSYQAVLMVFATFKSEQFLMQDRRFYAAQNTLFFSLIWSAFFAFLLVIFISIWGPGKALSQSNQPFWLYIIMILTLFLMSTSELFKYYSFKIKMFKQISFIFIFIAFSNNALNIVSGLIQKNPQNLIISLCVTYLCVLIFYIKKIKIQVKNIHFFVFLRNFKKRLAFVLSLTSSHFIGVFAMQIPALFISSQYGLKALGFYFLGYRLVSLPTQLIANAIGDVFRKHATDAFHENGRFDHLFKKTLQLTFILSFLPYALLYFLAPFLFSFFFGHEWRTAGEYAQILTLAAFVSFIAVPVDKGAIIREAKKYIFFWHVMRLFLNVMACALSFYYHLDIIIFLWLSSFSNIALYGFDLFYEYKLSKPS